MTKETMRSECLAKRNALSKEQAAQYSDEIFERLRPCLNDKKMIAVYYPYGKEVSTKRILEEFQGRDDVSLAMPVVLGMGKMEFYLVDKETTYKKGIYGIWEPVSAQKIDPKDIDLMIIPLVGFDETRQRIGHGMAYFDRYLMRCHNILKIGLAYECQKVKNVHADAHDIPLDMIITEQNIYE